MSQTVFIKFHLEIVTNPTKEKHRRFGERLGLHEMKVNANEVKRFTCATKGRRKNIKLPGIFYSQLARTSEQI